MSNFIGDILDNMYESNIEYEGSKEDYRTGQKTEFYLIKTDNIWLRFWNSSNSSQPYNIDNVLYKISNEISEGFVDGSIYDEKQNTINWLLFSPSDENYWLDNIV